MFCCLVSLCGELVVGFVVMNCFFLYFLFFFFFLVLFMFFLFSLAYVQGRLCGGNTILACISETNPRPNKV
jgi:hypothetical protein